MFYTFVRFLFSLYLTIFFGFRVARLENIPIQGSFILCANHTSNLDPPLVGSMIPSRKIYFMAKEELFRNPILGRALPALGAFPVRRGTVDKRSLTHALDLLKNGQIIGLFPEGTRIRSGKLGNFFHGPAYLALKSNRPVLPVVIKWPEKLFGPVRIKVGSLLYFHDEGKIGKKILEKASSEIFEEMNGLWSGL